MTRRSGWTEQDRARAIGLGLTRGAVVASELTGIPRRSISRWLASPDAVVLRQETREQIAERLWGAVAEGVQAVTEGLRDPRSRLGDRAAALRIVIEGHALISGGATSRTETVTTPRLSDEQRIAARDFIGAIESATDAELAEWATTEAGQDTLRQLRDGLGGSADVG